MFFVYLNEIFRKYIFYHINGNLVLFILLIQPEKKLSDVKGDIRKLEICIYYLHIKLIKIERSLVYFSEMFVWIVSYCVHSNHTIHEAD